MMKDLILSKTSNKFNFSINANQINLDRSFKFLIENSFLSFLDLKKIL